MNALAVRAISCFAMAFLAHRWLMGSRSEAAEGTASSGGGTGGSAKGESPHQELQEVPDGFNFAIDDEWIVFLLDSVPMLLFFCSLSLVVLFWAKIYYAAILVSYPMLT